MDASDLFGLDPDKPGEQEFLELLELAYREVDRAQREGLQDGRNRIIFTASGSSLRLAILSCSNRPDQFSFAHAAAAMDVEFAGPVVQFFRRSGFKF